MGVQDNNTIRDELLPEIEMAVTPSKLSETVRIDIYRFSDEFTEYLAHSGIISSPNGIAVDTIEMPLVKFPGFCSSVRDAYRNYRASQNNADV